MPTMQKNKMIEQGFNCADSTIKEMNDFFETRVEILEPKEDKKNFSSFQKIEEFHQELDRGRFRLQCRRVQQRINQSLPSKKEVP